jgi:adenylate kinase family enzyme
MVYTTGVDSADTHVIEIKNNNLTLYNIDSHFQKEHRLSTLGRWEDEVFQDIYKNDVDLIVIVGGPLQGKTTLAQQVSKVSGYKLVDWKSIEEAVRAKLTGPEGEPFEGKVPLSKIEEAVGGLMKAEQKTGGRAQFIFDSYPHDSPDAFASFLKSYFGVGWPEIVFDLRNSCTNATIIASRLKKKLGADDISEEQQAELKNQQADQESKVGALIEIFRPQIERGRIRYIDNLPTDAVSEDRQL